VASNATGQTRGREGVRLSCVVLSKDIAPLEVSSGLLEPFHAGTNA